MSMARWWLYIQIVSISYTKFMRGTYCVILAVGEFAVELRPAHQGFERSIYIFYGLGNDGLAEDSGFPMMNLCLLGQMGIRTGRGL
jgi:hypothetical protein